MFDRLRAHDERHALFGGIGTVQVWDLMGRLRLDPFAAVLGCELSAGGSVGVHVQEHFPEIVVCVSGEGTAHVDDVPHPFGPGSVVGLPLGSTLALANESLAEPLRYLIIKARG